MCALRQGQAAWPHRTVASIRRAGHGRVCLRSAVLILHCGATNSCQTVAIASGGKQGRKENNQGGERGEILKSGQHQEPVSMTTTPYYSCSNCCLHCPWSLQSNSMLPSPHASPQAWLLPWGRRATNSPHYPYLLTFWRRNGDEGW